MRFLNKLCSFVFPLLLSELLQIDAITNGRVAGSGYPWIGILRTDSSAKDYRGLFCTSSIIAPTLVLTAAHCLVGRTDSIVAVFDQPVLTEGLGGQRSKAKQIHYNPRFNAAALKSNMDFLGIDIALIELETPIQLAAYPPIAHESHVKAGSTVQAIGFGYMPNGNGQAVPSKDLLTVQQVVVEPTNCVSSHALSYTICTDIRSGGTCEGDSGSPLLAQASNNQPIIVGVSSRVVSEGIPADCSQGNDKNAFTSVAAVRSWIVPSLEEASVSQGILTLKVGPNFKPTIRIEIKATGGMSLAERVFDVSQANGWTVQTKILAYTGYLDDVVSIEVSLSNSINGDIQTVNIQF